MRVSDTTNISALFGSIEFLISVSDAFADGILTVTVPRELAVSLYHLAVLGL